MLGAFESDGRGPIDSSFVIVVYCDADAVLGIVKTEVNGAVFDAQEIVDAFAFVGGVDFGDALFLFGTGRISQDFTKMI